MMTRSQQLASAKDRAKLEAVYTAAENTCPTCFEQLSMSGSCSCDVG